MESTTLKEDLKSNPPEPATASGGASRVPAQIMLVLVTLLLCVAMLEIGMRAVGRFRNTGIEGFYVARGVSFGLKTNCSKTIAWPSATFTVYTCDQGFRSAQTGPRKLGDKPYCAVLGSSEVFGNGLDYEQTFVGVFAEKMQRDNVGVINLAMPGHHYMEQEEIFREFAASVEREPEIVLICLNPLFIGGYDDIHKEVTVRMGELFDKDHWMPAMTRMVLANSSASYCFFRDGIRAAQAKYFPSRDFPLSFYVERYSTKHPFRTEGKSNDFLRRLGGLERYIESLNARPVCVYFPTVGGFALNKLKADGEADGIEPFDTEYYRELARSHCASEGIQFIDAEPLLQKMFDEGKTLNFRGDAHFNGPTSKAIGEYLYESLRSHAQTASK